MPRTIDMNPNSQIRVEMFSRPDCHLCEVTLALIEKLAHRYPLRLTITDVEQDPQLEARYGQRLPVICIHGEDRRSGRTVLDYPIEESTLERELGRLWNP